MLKSHRICLRPTPDQEALLLQYAGYARFAYNWDLGEWLSDRSLRPRWDTVKRIIAPWGGVLGQNAAKYAIIDLGQACQSCNDSRHKRRDGVACRRVGFPRFKRRRHEQGFRADNGPDTVRVKGNSWG